MCYEQATMISGCIVALFTHWQRKRNDK
ncbi:type I toxin-antitoxin system Fst family toxin [Staphylococcus pasteuri]|nr:MULTISPECIES: type I toxin-antitoxin system Fst family toxin [Staphylococcus]MCO0861685.1 type I toxin-antitoxin system Fst family toxin [Staphylococcus pasteuri]MCO5359874.1 type I toxin-antitoxin system Fst family toxin [Staphylococcus pasteuri]MEB6612476.1 type I toxin-antitoxin system Fst family toxin [Staphylococcus pasteuri]UXR68596.1 type I toxin-antitoxin system Fst family toxin [Staphylococcus pasteuri]